MSLGLALIAAVSAAAAPIPPEAAMWIRNNAVPIGAHDADPDQREAEALSRVVKGARIIGLGEPQHGHSEPLLYRNRLIRHLVGREGLTAVALESGIAETKPAADYVLGGAGTAEAAAAHLSWGFNQYAENLTLLSWLRRWNDSHPRAKVRLYGIDISGGDSKSGFGRARSTLDWLNRYLGDAAPAASAPLRADLTRWAPSFSPAGYAALSARERAALDLLPARITAWLTKHRSALVRAAGADAFRWGQRIAGDTADQVRVLRIYPADANRISPGLLEASAIRERAMIANSLWALGLEGRRGRILLFQSNSHVAATELIPTNRRPIGNSQPTGAGLRARLGSGYRIILTASSLGKGAEDEAIGTVDRAFVTAGVAPAFLDIRAAPRWWGERQTLAHGGTRVNAAVPKQAYDALIYLDRLTPARNIRND